MGTLEHYGLAALVIVGVNLLPAFGPPTWAVVVFLELQFGLPALGLVPLAAISATLGRVVLALGSRRLRGRLSTRRLASLEAARVALHDHGAKVVSAVLLFFVSPLPSAQLFVAAGLLELPLPRLAFAFLLGRLGTYALYLHGASLARESFGEVLLDGFRSPLGIALQLVTLLLLGLLLGVDWSRWLGRKAPPSPPSPC